MKKGAKNNRNNKKAKNVRFFYFEKQKNNNTCRQHAINNALGRSILTQEKYGYYNRSLSILSHVLCLGSLGIVMNLTCKTIVGEVESSSSFILITTSLVSF
jgi:hypothetical protein